MKEILAEIPFSLIMIYLAIVGLCIGSFLNVVIYRVPERLSIVKPGSFCPACKNPIKPWQNIPVISYLLLGGKCAKCKLPISLRYPLVETLTMIITIWPLYKFGITWDAAGGIILGWFLIALAFIDFDTFTLPDAIVLPMGLSGIVFVFLKGGLSAFKIGIASSLIGAGFLLLLYLTAKIIFRKEALGTGDITMTAAFGMFLHPFTIGLALFLGALTSLITTILWSIVKKQGIRNLEIPFGPSLAIGSWVSYMYGTEIIRSYLSFIF